MTNNKELENDSTFEAESETESSSSLSPSHDQDDEGSQATKVSVLARGGFFSSLSYRTSHVTVDSAENENVEVQMAASLNDELVDDGTCRALNTSESAKDDESCTNHIELCGEDETDPEPDLEAIALSQKVQNVTPQECRRFLKIRTMKQAEAKLENYKEWRLTYHLDDGAYRYSSSVGETDADDHDDDALWERAIRKTLLSFPPSSQTSDESSSSKTGTGTGTVDDMNADNLVQQLPRFIRMHDPSENTQTHSGIPSSPSKADDDGRGDRRVLHILMNMIDSSLAPLKFYALLIAIYLDLHLDRHSMEDIVTLIDVRKGKGWCNPAPLTMLPFLKETVRHMEYFPERMYRCIVYPVPYPAKFIWHMAKGFLKESMVKRVRLHWGSSAMESPVPTSLGNFFEDDDLETFENTRVSEFRTV